MKSITTTNQIQNLHNMPEFLNIELMNWEDFWDLILRCVFNTLVVLYVVRILYYKASRKKDYLFTYILISLVVFFMIMLLENIKVELGFALPYLACSVTVPCRFPSGK